MFKSTTPTNLMLLFLIETNFVMTMSTPISRSRCMCKMARLERRSLVIKFRRYVLILTGPDPGRCNRCKCIGQNKIADAFIDQISPANNKKQHFKRKHKAHNAQISTKSPFPVKEYKNLYWGTKVWNIDINFVVFKK